MLDLRALIALQVKASGSLPRKQSQRTAKPTAFYALSATHKKGVVKPRLLKIRGRITKKYAVSALLRGVVQESRAVSEGTKICVVILNSKIDGSLKRPC